MTRYLSGRRISRVNESRLIREGGESEFYFQFSRFLIRFKSTWKQKMIFKSIQRLAAKFSLLINVIRVQKILESCEDWI